ncbi:hypothetical protein BH18THE2_BH18THE2_23530 [soil metagenome]
MKAKLFLNILIMLFAIIIISGCIYSSYYGIENRSANAQQPINATQPLAKPIGVKIVSPIANQTIPVGELNISGTSTDTATTDCNVYVDVNDFRPLQNTTAAGPGGQTDYSNWTFTYTKKYHLITEGQNELTAKVSCSGNSLINNTSNISSANSKWYSINVTGMAVQTPAEKSQNENQTQSSDANQQQNVTVSDEHGPETLNLTTQPPLSKNTQTQKIADLNEKELDIRTQEDQNSQDNIPVQIESSTQDKSTIPNSFNAPMDQGEETGSSSQQLMPTSDTITEDTLSNKEEPLIGGPTEQREIQPPLQMFELPNAGEAGTQVVGEDYQDIDLGDYDPNPQAHQLHSQLPLDQDQQIPPEPEQQPQMQPPVQMFDISNQEHETVDGQQVIKTEDDDDEAGSAEEIFSMITGNSGQENDLQDTVDGQQVIKTEDDDDEAGSAEEIFSMITANSGQESDLQDKRENVQEKDSEEVIADQIPLVLSYTTEIQNTLE